MAHDQTRRVSGLLAWQLAASTLLAFYGALSLGLPPWSLGSMEIAWLGLIVLTYWASTMVPSAAYLMSRRLPWLLVILQTAALFGVAWLVSPVLASGWMAVWPFLAQQIDWDLFSWPLPVGLLLSSACFAIASNGLLARQPSIRPGAVLTLSGAVVLVLICSLEPLRGPWLYRGLEQPVVREMDASRHRLRFSYFRDRLPGPAWTGGALSAVDDHVLLMTGSGLFYDLYFPDAGDRMDVHPLQLRVPLNSEAFVAANPEMRDFWRVRFRAFDLLLIDTPERRGKTLLASHHYFHAAQSCYTFRVSALDAPWEDFTSGAAPAQWRTVFEAQPCLPMSVEGRTRFAGHQTGGALTRTAHGTILLALGDSGFDGVQTPSAVSQDPQSSFGKVIEIELSTGQSRIVTSGHRGPSGLYVDAAGRVWLTEHGPRGGDELNLIRDGRDYGWPQHSLGTQYGKLTWPLQVDAGAAQAFEPPAYAWIPSIGVSALTGLEGPGFDAWRGDLIVSSLVARSLYRLQLLDDRPLLAEPIPVFERVRDVIQDHRGRLVFWTDRGVVGLVEAVPQESRR